ncbi:hypothetical protein RCL1_005469 [Eukaryota sp. TZLM3-RCL]
MTRTSLRFCKELPATNVVVLSQRDNSGEAFTKVIDRLYEEMDETHNFIAVDAEWYSAPYSSPTRIDVIQFSSFTTTLIVQVHGETSLNSSVVELLTDPAVLKVFKDPTKDLTRFSRYFGITVAPYYDVSDMCSMLSWINYCKNPIDDSFARMLSSVGLTALIPKDASISKSNWSAEKLSANQIKYAAYDSAFINTIYSIMTRTHPTILNETYDSWLETKPQTNTLTVYKKLSQIGTYLPVFLCVYARNPVTNTVVGPSTIANFDDLELFGVCKGRTCHLSLPINASLLLHQCFKRFASPAKCPDCSSLFIINPCLLGVHRTFVCKSRRQNGSNTELLKKLATTNTFRTLTPF